MILLPVLLGLLHLASAELPWWQTSTMYQVYVRSFQDSDGDGNGDLRGVIEKVPYLKEIGVGIIWLSPIFDSPWKDMGYDVRDFRTINPAFGTNADLEELIEVVHQHGIKIVLDFVMNHSSDEHVWFNASRYRQDGKDDYYVWKDPVAWDGEKPIPPNNWLSIFDGDAWTYDEVRKQFYLHQFGAYQPDFNFRNPQIIEEMKGIMRYWFAKNLDGFRMDAVPFLVEDAEWRDEPDYPNCHASKPVYCKNHIYTQNVEETYAVMKELDTVITEYENTDSPKYLFSEAYASQQQVLRYYGDHTTSFNFDILGSMRQDITATELRGIVDRYMYALGDKRWPNWVIGNHDNPRIGTKVGEQMIDALSLLQMMLPGMTVTYYGDEIGMLDTFIRNDQKVDVTGVNRDAERTPMQWNQCKNSGFSAANRTWLPLNPGYYKYNVESERADENSHLNWYKKMVDLRKNFIESREIQTANYGEWVFAFKRNHNGKEFYVIINFNNYQEEVTLSKGFQNIPNILYVHSPTLNSFFEIGEKIKTGSKITLQPRSAVGLSSYLPEHKRYADKTAEENHYKKLCLKLVRFYNTERF